MKFAVVVSDCCPTFATFAVSFYALAPHAALFGKPFGVIRFILRVTVPTAIFYSVVFWHRVLHLVYKIHFASCTVPFSFN